MVTNTKWLASVHGNAGARLRLFCFPYAGGAANLFAQWWRKLPADIEVCPIELPGRWSRWREEPVRDMATIARLVVQHLADQFAAKPYALYGHSLGGLIAYETALRLREIGTRLPTALLVSGRRPPDSPLYRLPLHKLADDAFIKGIAEHYEPIHPSVLAEPDSKAMFLKLVRADMEMFETYQAKPAAPLDLGIWAFSANADRAAPPSEMHGWKRYSTREVKTQVFDGGHFFIRDSEAFWRALGEALGSCASERSAFL